MTPATYNFTVVRGTSGPTQGIVFRLKDSSGDPIEFDDVRLTINKKSALLLRVATIDPDDTLTVTDVNSAEITWAPTAEQTRLIPLGAKATYEVEVRHDGFEVVYMIGTITGIAGINDDEDAS